VVKKTAAKHIAVGVGRPTGKKNSSALDRIRQDKDKILDASRLKALTGDGPAAEFCFTAIGELPSRRRANTA
jgi:hypothetical protein